MRSSQVRARVKLNRYLRAKPGRKARYRKALEANSFGALLQVLYEPRIIVPSRYPDLTLLGPRHSVILYSPEPP